MTRPTSYHLTDLTGGYYADAPSHGLDLYADGCCEPNPGQGGWAFVVYRDGLEIAHDFGGDPSATNNRMELQSLIQALEWIASHAADEPITVWSDSRYCVDGCIAWRHSWRAKGWKRKGPNATARNQIIANLELWKQIDAVLTLNPLIQVQWCKGHAGIPENIRADELASIGRASVIEDTRPLHDLDRQYRAIMEEPS